MKEKQLKKILKLSALLLIMIGIIASSFTNVNAHSVELDPDSVIHFPWFVSNGQGEITIDDSITGYTLYYQAVEFNDSDYDQIEEINSTGEQELDTINTEIEALSAEYDNLETILDEAYEAYQEAINSGITGTDLEELQTAYETAQTNYDNKRDEYNNKIDEYNNKVIEINTQIKELTPSYVEENWIETEDGTFSIDLSQFSGNKAFAIWVRLVTADGTTIYDEGTYTMSGTRVESIEVEGISLDRTTLTLQEGSSYTLTATIIPSDATNKLITWTSDNEDVATVSNGRVMAKSSGTATITATTSDGEYTATCEVTVVASGDNTVATMKLPNAGINVLVVVGIISMIIISIISYKIYARYKDVK